MQSYPLAEHYFCCRIRCGLVTKPPLRWAPAVIGHLDVVIQQNVGKHSLDLVSGEKPAGTRITSLSDNVCYHFKQKFVPCMATVSKSHKFGCECYHSMFYALAFLLAHS